MFTSASTRCFWDKPFTDACSAIQDLEFDKVELWIDENSDGLKPSRICADVESVYSEFRESTRLTPIAIHLANDVDRETFAAVAQLGKLLKVAQLTVPSSPVGTPFNSEIDRLREMCTVAGRDGLRVSIKTESGHLTEDPHTAVELCQSVKGLGITLDPSYFICGRSVDVDFIFPHVYHVHLRDTSPQQLQVPVGLGDVDYSRIVSQLSHEGYTSALSVDLIPDMTDTTSRPLEMRKLRLLVESLLV